MEVNEETEMGIMTPLPLESSIETAIEGSSVSSVVYTLTQRSYLRYIPTYIRTARKDSLFYHRGLNFLSKA